MKKCVINLSSTNAWYPKGQKRLANHLKEHFRDGDVLLYDSESQVNAPLHENDPYAFKPYCFYDAMSKGYDLILWADASVWTQRDIEPIFNMIKEKGYFLIESGHFAGRWTNDNCLNYFSKSKNIINDIPLFITRLFGLNMNHDICKLFLGRWKHAADHGAFAGSWDNHRHDQTCGSIIAHDLGMELLNPTDYCAYVCSSYRPKRRCLFLFTRNVEIKITRPK